MTNTDYDSNQTIVKKRIWAYILTAAILLIGYSILRNTNWQGNTQLHTIMETVATFLALTIGVMALLRFYSKKNNTFLFIGSGFLGTSFLDGYHTIVTSTFFAESFPSVPSHLIPWSWIASRIFLSFLLLISYYAWKREERLGEKGRIYEGYVYLFVATLTILSFLFFAFVPLPRAYYPELFFGRPEEFIPAIFFLFALIGYLKKGHWKTSNFDHWLILSLIVGFLSQAVFMSFSNKLFDFQFDAAHLLKKVSYIFVLVGLLISMFKLFTKTEKQKELLEQGIFDKEVESKKLKESKELLNGFLDNSPSVMYIKDSNRKYIIVNSLFELLFNVKLENIIGKTDYEIFPKEMAEAFQKNDLKVLEKKGPITLEEIAPHEDGNRTYISQKFPLFDNDKNIYAIAGISTDITEKINLERDLKRGEGEVKSQAKILHLQSSALEAAVNGIAITDIKGHINWVNSGFTKLTGYSKSEALSTDPSVLKSGKHPDSFYKDLWETISKGKVWQGELINKRKDGSFYDEEMTITPVKNTKGIITNYVAIKLDITDRKNDEENLLKYSQQLETKNKELQEFTYIASHDLREPLRKVHSFGERLKDKFNDKLGDRGSDYLERMMNASDRMQTLIDDLLNYSRVTSHGKLFDKINLQNVARAVISDLSVLILESESTIILSSLPSINADESQMRQLLQNLIGNAVKFSKPDISPEIKIYSEDISEDDEFSPLDNSIKEWVKIIVEDNGIGIDMEYSERIFKVFERLHGRSEYKGTGIGLSIVKKIVERHNGEIFVNSKLNEGTKFEIYLPKENINDLEIEKI